MAEQYEFEGTILIRDAYISLQFHDRISPYQSDKYSIIIIDLYNNNLKFYIINLTKICYTLMTLVLSLVVKIFYYRIYTVVGLKTLSYIPQQKFMRLEFSTPSTEYAVKGKAVTRNSLSIFFIHNL